MTSTSVLGQGGSAAEQASKLQSALQDASTAQLGAPSSGGIIDTIKNIGGSAGELIKGGYEKFKSLPTYAKVGAGLAGAADHLFQRARIHIGDSGNAVKQRFESYKSNKFQKASNLIDETLIDDPEVITSPHMSNSGSPGTEH